MSRLSRPHLMFGRPRPLQGRTAEQLLLMRRGRPARRAHPRAARAARSGPGVTTLELDAPGRGLHPRPRRHPELPARPRLPRTPSARASTTRSSTASRGSAGARARATCLDRLRRRGRGLERRRRLHGRRRRPRRRPPGGPRASSTSPRTPLGRHRRAARRRPPVRGRRGGRGEHRGRGERDGRELRRSSRSTSGHGIGTPMHDGPADPQLRGARQRARRSSTASPAPSSRWSPSATSRHHVLADDWTVATARRVAGGALGALGRRDARTACGSSPPSTAARLPSRLPRAAYAPLDAERLSPPAHLRARERVASRS